MFIPSRIRILDDTTMEKIHMSTAEVLERCGINFENEQAIKILQQAGAHIDGKNVKIPIELFEKSLSMTPSSFTMCGLNKKNAFVVGEGQTRARTDPSFGPIFIQEEGKGRRLPLVKDLIECYKLHQASEFCDVAGGMPVDPTDSPAEGQHLHLLHAMVRHLDKPLRTYISTRKEFEEMCALYEIAAGKKGWLDEHVSFFLTINPLSPMSYEESSLESMILYAEKHQAVCLQSCAITGFTSPMSLLGTTVLQNAEILAGNVLLQTVNPGTPFLFGATSSRPDMRTGSYVCASPEADLMNLPSIQIAKERYHIPTRMMCGITDAKITDAQAGLETMQTMMTAVLAGTDMLHGMGSIDSMNGTAHEKFLMGQEIFSRINCFMKGILELDSNLSVEEIIETAPSGTYMMNDATIMNCGNTWHPIVSTQDPIAIWEEEGATNLAERARDLAKKVISESPIMLLDKEKDEEIIKFIKKCGY